MRRSDRYLSHMARKRNLRMRFKTITRWVRYWKVMSLPDGTLPVTSEGYRLLLTLLTPSTRVTTYTGSKDGHGLMFRGSRLVEKPDLEIPAWL